MNVERNVAAARRYLDLAERALQPAAPRLIAIGGRSGTGKSSLAAAIAPAVGPLPGAVVIRSDVLRKRLFGRQPTERLPEEAYAPEVSRRVFAAVADHARALLAAGQAVIADGVYGRPSQRAEIEAVAAAAGVPFTGLWLTAPEVGAGGAGGGETGRRIGCRRPHRPPPAPSRRHRDLLVTDPRRPTAAPGRSRCACCVGSGLSRDGGLGRDGGIGRLASILADIVAEAGVVLGSRMRAAASS